MPDLHQEKIDLAKIILFAELLKKAPEGYTRSEHETMFWLTADPVIQEVLNRIDAPASS